MKLSPTQNACLIEATIDDLMAYRRGFARSKTGPFFRVNTVRRLVETGHLRAFYPSGGRPGLRVSARANA